MILRSKYVTGVIALCALFGAASGQETKLSVKTLAWISGCWEMNQNGVVTTERWGSATENLMMGFSQTVKNGKSVGYEFLQIVNNGDGVMYVARPHNKKDDTSFAAIKTTEKEIMFVNRTNDFPTRIIYRLEDKDALSARIEGTIGGKEKAMNFPYKRVRCE
jgi:uncharacterized protein DUF6265